MYSELAELNEPSFHQSNLAETPADWGAPFASKARKQPKRINDHFVFMVYWSYREKYEPKLAKLQLIEEGVFTTNFLTDWLESAQTTYYNIISIP